MIMIILTINIKINIEINIEINTNTCLIKKDLDIRGIKINALKLHEKIE
jgi:hypothetical protein